MDRLLCGLSPLFSQGGNQIIQHAVHMIIIFFHFRVAFVQSECTLLIFRLMFVFDFFYSRTDII